MKSLLFFLVLFVIGFIAWSVANQKDGFQDTPPEGADPTLTIPIVSPRYQTLTNGEVKPFTEPSAALLAPPPGQTASVNSLPRDDPAEQKSDPRRIQSVYESMQGFFKKDAPGLQKMGDPSIQLPLATAKSDLARLKDELDVLKKNPGLESTLTQDDVNAVEANLGYLQKKWRMSANANSGDSPMPPSEEGFSSTNSRGVYGWFSSFFGGSQEGFQTSTGSTTGSQPGSTTGSITGSQPGSRTGSQPGSTTATGGSTTIALRDLQDLTLKISIEIVRLQASGATNTNTQSRISVLTAIKKRIDDLITEVQNDPKRLATIPLTKADIDKFLPAMSNPNSALPELITDTGLQSVLSSLFPNYSLGDLSGASVAKKLFDTYMKDMTKNLSWDISLNYKGKAEQDIAANYASAMNDARYAVDNTGTPLASNATGIINATNTTASSPYRGVFESVVSSLTGQPVTAAVANGPTSSLQGSSSTPGAAAQPLDWKERSKQICNQITARGYSAYDFGCMKENDVISDNFSWRGYTRMVCTRLGTLYDPSIPELCGCPPPSWIGWRP